MATTIATAAFSPLLHGTASEDRGDSDSAFGAIASASTAFSAIASAPPVSASSSGDDDLFDARAARAGLVRGGSPSESTSSGDTLTWLLTDARLEAVESRFTVLESLGLARENLLDPYNRNVLKADRPIFGEDWLLNVELGIDLELEAGRSLSASTGQPPRSERIASTDLLAGLSLIKGDSVFRPPDWRFDVAATFRRLQATNLSTRTQTGRTDSDARRDLGFERAFVERFLRAKSDRYDFDSLRIGLQPLISDFRGFLFNEAQPAVRLFGNAEGNRVQYNLAWIRRLNRDRISRLNTSEFRNEMLLFANLYLQDAPWLGFQLEGVALYHRNRERAASTPHAPRRDSPFDVVYLGLNGDGHWGRINLTLASYLAVGRGRLEGAPRRSQQIFAHLAAAEASIDFDWYRLRAYALLASGDRSPDDGRAQGFDVVRDQIRFAGLQSGFFQSQSLRLPASLPGSPARALTPSGGLLPSLRSTRDPDGANYVNPGLRAVGIGADLSVLPELTLRLNVARLEFDRLGSLVASMRSPGSSRHLGEDASIAIEYRPLLINNVVLHLVASGFRPGGAFSNLFGENSHRILHSTRLELSLRY